MNIHHFNLTLRLFLTMQYIHYPVINIMNIYRLATNIMGIYRLFVTDIMNIHQLDTIITNIHHLDTFSWMFIASTQLLLHGHKWHVMNIHFLADKNIWIFISGHFYIWNNEQTRWHKHQIPITDIYVIATRSSSTWCTFHDYSWLGCNTSMLWYTIHE